MKSELTKIFKHCFDGNWTFGNFNVNLKRLSIRALQLDVRHVEPNKIWN